jgi:hypothetical protein
MSPNISWSSEWNLRQVTLLVPRVLENLWTPGIRNVHSSQPGSKDPLKWYKYQRQALGYVCTLNTDLFLSPQCWEVTGSDPALFTATLRCYEFSCRGPRSGIPPTDLPTYSVWIRLQFGEKHGVKYNAVYRRDTAQLARMAGLHLGVYELGDLLFTSYHNFTAHRKNHHYMFRNT